MPYLIILALVAALIYFLPKYFKLCKDFNLKISNFKDIELKKQMDEYKNTLQGQFNQAMEQNKQMSYREATVIAEKWKAEYEDIIRKDAVTKSQAVVAGKVTEHFIPFLEGWKYNARDARFMGAPVDFIVFDGLSEGNLKQIIFVEVKTNKAQLNQREKQIRDIISNGKVRWEELRHFINAGVVKP